MKYMQPHKRVTPRLQNGGAHHRPLLSSFSIFTAKCAVLPESSNRNSTRSFSTWFGGGAAQFRYLLLGTLQTAALPPAARTLIQPWQRVICPVPGLHAFFLLIAAGLLLRVVWRLKKTPYFLEKADYCLKKVPYLLQKMSCCLEKMNSRYKKAGYYRE